VTPIEYRPWDGKRTDYWRRFLVISNNVFRQKLKSKWVLALLIIGVILTHVFSIIFYTILPHEDLTPEMMVGDEPPPERSGYVVLGQVTIEGPLDVEGSLAINGSIYLNGRLEIQEPGDVIGLGSVVGDGSPLANFTITNEGVIYVNGTVILDGELDLTGRIQGGGSLEGNCTILGFGSLTGIETEGESTAIRERQGGYLKGGLLVIFTILLASMICSDLIAEDLGDNSFILYFSRPIKSLDYLAGKLLGALWVLGLFTFLPLIIFCIAVMGTQSGDNYGLSLNVLGSTFIAGLLTTFIFVPYGILISSFTKRKAYAAIGIFMSFFVLIIIGNIFANFDKNWVLLDPTRVLYYSFDVLYGYSIPEGISEAILGVVLTCILVIPLVILYLRIHRKGVGK
jgi:ABC-type transport system involved in multi-copper enzyme maturation permease subunit